MLEKLIYYLKQYIFEGGGGVRTNYAKVMVVTVGVEGWCSDESTRLPPMWPGFDS